MPRDDSDLTSPNILLLIHISISYPFFQLTVLPRNAQATENAFLACVNSLSELQL